MPICRNDTDFGLAALVLLVGGAWLWARLPPRRAVAVLIWAGALLLLLLRQVMIALPLALIGWRYWRQGAAVAGPSRRERTGGQPSSKGRSQVESPALRMTLDHVTGAMEGVVTTGGYAGRALSGLGDADLRRFRAELEAAGDTDSLALLLAWMERVGRTVEAEPEEAAGGRMTRDEAYRVLGLPTGASTAEVRDAYRRLIRRVHPDMGGSDQLTALINAARDVLDPG